MRPGVVEEKLAAQSFADRVKAWERQHSSRASPDPGFPDSVPGKSVCPGWCLGSIDADRALAVSELVTYLRRVLRFFGAQTKGDGHDPHDGVEAQVCHSHLPLSRRTHPAANYFPL